jgi:hypothetical protein
LRVFLELLRYGVVETEEVTNELACARQVDDLPHATAREGCSRMGKRQEVLMPRWGFPFIALLGYTPLLTAEMAVFCRDKNWSRELHSGTN